MGLMDLRVIITLISFVAFLGIVFWAYGSRQKPRFDEAANLPFADEDMQARTLRRESQDVESADLQYKQCSSTESNSEVSRG